MSLFRLRLTRRSLLAAGAALFLAACSDDVGTTTEPEPSAFTSTVVFGASLEDVGNACNANPASCPPAPYASGRVSNGPLYVELIAQHYGTTLAPSRTGGTNYAYAGARTGVIAGSPQSVPNMNEQVDAYLAATPGANRASTLFILGGATVGNDIIAALLLGATNPQAAVAIVSGAVTNLAGQINKLYAAGARHIVVLNSTDIGATPLVRGQGAFVAAAASQLSAQFNAGLAAQVTAIRTASPGLELVLVDVGALTAQVLANPSQFGFTNTTQACVSGTTACATPDSYFFWDNFHPTAATGRLVSARAITAIDL